jgi:hypothetical protein
LYQSIAPSSMISNLQIRAARALLDWAARDLSQAARVSSATIQRIERIQGVSPVAQAQTLLDLRQALERAGVLFVGSPGHRPGVRLGRASGGAPDATYATER